MFETVNFATPIIIGYDRRLHLYEKIFVQFGYRKATKIFNLIYCIICVLLVMLQIIFIIDSGSTDLAIKCAVGIIIQIYTILSSIVSVIMEKGILQLHQMYLSNAWSLKNLNSEEQKQMKNVDLQWNVLIYIVIVGGIMLYVIFLPVFGDLTEVASYEAALKKYLGLGAPYPDLIYVSLFWFGLYTAFRNCFCLLYGIITIASQIRVLNRYIFHISSDYKKLKEDNETEKAYQKEMSTRLVVCMEKHLALNKQVSYLLDLISSVIPLYMMIGVSMSIAVLLSLATILQFFSTMMKIRSALIVIFNAIIVVSFCVGGQMLLDETSSIFDMLMTCPWENWNRKNRQILQIFMANCLQPHLITIAGFDVDLKLGLALVRTGISYALVLYQLKYGV